MNRKENCKGWRDNRKTLNFEEISDRILKKSQSRVIVAR